MIMTVRKFLAVMLACFMVSALMVSAMNAYAAEPKVGDVVDYTLYTDITTYINGSPIESFNINGYTAVVVEDIANYGFAVEWVASGRRLEFYVSDNPNNGNYMPAKTDKSQVGKRKSPVFYTDITTVWGFSPYWGYTQVNAYNIGGRTIVYVDDIAKLCGMKYEWKPTERKLELMVVKPWVTSVSNTEYDDTIRLNFPVDYTFKKQQDGSFVISDGHGSDFGAIEKFELSSSGVSFSLSTMADKNGNFGSLNVSGSVNNIVYGERVAENTPDRFNELYKYFSVCVNDKVVKGEMSRSQGNGHEDYIFIFDKLLELNDIETIVIIIGDLNR